ncbi:hypothetical protein ACHWQZ_G004180 [Mnemiopsis leidyi]
MKFSLRKPRLTPETALIIKNGVGDLGKKSWTFASMMFLITMKPGTMDMVAGHTLAICIATFLFANSIGSLIDRISRLTAIRLAIGGQALGVAVIALMATAVQLKGDILECVPVELYTVFAVLCLMDVVSKLAKEAGNIIIGRDWIVTVCRGDRSKLASLNVWLTRTDELFGIVAPLAISFLRQVLTMLQTTIIGASCYFVCTCIQYSLIMFVYNRVEGIRSKDRRSLGKRTGRSKGGTKEESDAKPRLELKTEAEKAGSNGPHRKPIKSWLPSSLQRKTNESEQEKPAHRKRRQSPDRPDVEPGSTPAERGGGRGRGRGRGGRGEHDHKSRDATDGDFQESINSGSLPEYPTTNQGRGRGHHTRGRGGARSEGRGNDSPGQRKKKEPQQRQSRKPNVFDPRSLLNNFNKFFSYRIALAGVCTSMQHLSLVSFGIVTMLYLRTQGLNFVYLGVSRSLCGVIAIFASVVYPSFVKKNGLILAGWLGCGIQFVACFGALISMYVPAYAIVSSSANNGGVPVNRCSLNLPQNQSYPMLDYDSKFGVVDDNFYLGDQSNHRFRNKTGNILLPREDLPVGVTGVRPLKNSSVVGVRPLRNSSGQIGVKYHPVSVEVDSSGRNATEGKDGKLPPKNSGKKKPPPKGRKVDTNNDKERMDNSDRAEQSTLPSSAAFLLLGSLLFGRFGTTLSKVSIHQLYQEEVPKQERGMIAGVQVTMNTFFTTISMSLVLYASTPTNFIYLVWMSMVVETVIFVLYSYFAYNYTFHRAGISDKDVAQPQILEEEETSTISLTSFTLEDENPDQSRGYEDSEPVEKSSVFQV